MKANQMGIVIAGYTKEEWVRWREEMEDGDTFHWSFEEWSLTVTETVSEQKANGQIAFVHTIRIDEFLQFASENGLPLTNKTRSLYATKLP